MFVKNYNDKTMLVVQAAQKLTNLVELVKVVVQVDLKPIC